MKKERLDFLAKNPLYTKRFAWYVGRRCRSSTVSDIACELNLDWHTVKELDKQYMTAQLERAGTPAPKAIGIDEISIRKGHTYRIVVSDLSDIVRSGLVVQIARRTACGSSMTGWERISPKAFVLQ
ncbi:MAG: helix-turn-helix domain-containing protein [Candidatus Nitrotoga sp.]